MISKKQKLELTWIGKENRPRLEPRILLEDPEKSYHAAQRVTEHDLFDNRLIFGDNLLALKALEQEFTGKIKCVFIDPPYNISQVFAMTVSDSEAAPFQRISYERNSRPFDFPACGRVKSAARHHQPRFRDIFKIEHSDYMAVVATLAVFLNALPNAGLVFTHSHSPVVTQVFPGIRTTFHVGCRRNRWASLETFQATWAPPDAASARAGDGVNNAKT
jgi:hypothetical protein